VSRRQEETLGEKAASTIEAEEEKRHGCPVAADAAGTTQQAKVAVQDAAVLFHMAQGAEARTEDPAVFPELTHDPERGDLDGAVALQMADHAEVAAQAAAFEKEGGFTERLFRVRTGRREK